MTQQDINLKLFRRRLRDAHAQAPDEITQEMLDEFEADVASGDEARKLIAHGRAERWLGKFDEKRSNQT